MNLDRFFMYAEKEWKEELRLMKEKGEEYTMDSQDKLENFKQVAGLLDRPGVNDAIMFGLMKHFFSIVNYVNKGTEASDEDIFGRIRDLRNYSLLLSANIWEEKVEAAKQAGGTSCRWPIDATEGLTDTSGENLELHYE